MNTFKQKIPFFVYLALPVLLVGALTLFFSHIHSDSSASWNENCEICHHTQSIKIIALPPPLSQSTIVIVTPEFTSHELATQKWLVIFDARDPPCDSQALLS